MVNKELECFAPKDRQMVAVELGSSYGNTTLSYKCGHNWDAAVDFWLKEDTPMVKKWDFHVVAIDISEKALGFGKRRGIFDEVLVHDFADAPAPELAAALERADFLTSIMTTFYIPTDRLNEMLFKFLGNRSKPKVRTKPRPLPRGSSARRACEVAGAGARGAARALSGRGGAHSRGKAVQIVPIFRNSKRGSRVHFQRQLEKISGSRVLRVRECFSFVSGSGGRALSKVTM